MGQAPPGDSYNVKGEGLPLVAGAGDFSASIPSVKKFTTAPGKLSREGDIILGIRASIGERVWSDRTYCLGRGVAGLRTSEKLDRNYLWHWLGHSADQLKAKGRGATFLQVNRADIGEMKIPLPPLDEQRRIAAILDRADCLRALRLKAISALDGLVQSLFNEAGQGQGAASMTMPFSDAYWFQEGPGIRKWQFTDNGVKLLNVGNITAGGRLDLLKTERHVSVEEVNGRYKHFLVDPGDLVVASSGISFDTDGLLRTRGAFVKAADLPLCMNTSTIRFKARKGLSDLTYLRSWLNSPEFRSQISRLVTGSAQQNFGPSHLRQLQITLPPAAVQERFGQQVGAIERHRAQCLAALSRSDRMAASLRSRAFRGELAHNAANRAPLPAKIG